MNPLWCQLCLVPSHCSSVLVSRSSRKSLHTVKEVNIWHHTHHIQCNIHQHASENISIKTSSTDETSEEEIQTSSQRITRVSRTVAQMTATTRDPWIAIKPWCTTEKKTHTRTVTTQPHLIIKSSLDLNTQLTAHIFHLCNLLYTNTAICCHFHCSPLQNYINKHKSYYMWTANPDYIQSAPV